MELRVVRGLWSNRTVVFIRFRTTFAMLRMPGSQNLSIHLVQMYNTTLGERIKLDAVDLNQNIVCVYICMCIIIYYYQHFR